MATTIYGTVNFKEDKKSDPQDTPFAPQYLTAPHQVSTNTTMNTLLTLMETRESIRVLKVVYMEPVKRLVQKYGDL